MTEWGYAIIVGDRRIIQERGHGFYSDGEPDTLHCGCPVEVVIGEGHQEGCDER